MSAKQSKVSAAGTPAAALSAAVQSASQQAPAKWAPPLLSWYHQNRRMLPFREDPTPYHVWVSEIMLQQTQVATALPYYRHFIAALPNVAALAACGEERLHKLWQGLGYYSRVRNMQKAAQQVVQQHGGELPGNYEALRTLPGIGDYTAGAIASIAFGLPHTAVDGNVLRVAARLLACGEDITLPATKKHLTAAVQAALPRETPGDFNQAMMELGALVCTPKSPHCGTCPLAPQCAARAGGLTTTLPVKAKARPKRTEDICVLVVQSEDRVLLHRRPPQGLLANLWEPLTLPGPLARQQAEHQLRQLVPVATITARLPPAQHVFTHRIWRMQGWLCQAPTGTQHPGPGYHFATPQELEETYALPSAFSAYAPFLFGKSPK